MKSCGWRQRSFHSRMQLVKMSLTVTLTSTLTQNLTKKFRNPHIQDCNITTNTPPPRPAPNCLYLYLFCVLKDPETPPGWGWGWEWRVKKNCLPLATWKANADRLHRQRSGPLCKETVLSAPRFPTQAMTVDTPLPPSPLGRQRRNISISGAHRQLSIKMHFSAGCTERK